MISKNALLDFLPRLTLCLAGLVVSALFWWQLENWSRFNIFGSDPGSYPGFYSQLPYLLLRGKIVIGLAVLCSLLFLVHRNMLLFSGFALTMLAFHSVAFFRFGFIYFVLGVIAYSCWLIYKYALETYSGQLLLHPWFPRIMIVAGGFLILYFWLFLEMLGDRGIYTFRLLYSWFGVSHLWWGRLLVLATLIFLFISWKKLNIKRVAIVFLLLGFILGPPGYQWLSTSLFVNSYVSLANLLFIHLGLSKAATHS
jgi:hypothetical protein